MTSFGDCAPTNAAIHSSAVSGRTFSGKPLRPSILGKLMMEEPALHSSSLQCAVPFVAVTTTLNSSADCVTDLARLIQVIVVADQGTSPPSDEAPDNLIFFSLEQQQQLYPTLSSVIPLRSFARKNLGYLFAMDQLDACFVLDFDDDNCFSDAIVGWVSSLVGGSRGPIQPKLSSSLWITSPSSVVNPYLLYGSPDFIWPRG